MRIFWDHAPAGGEIHIRSDVCEGMRYYTDIKICRCCGQFARSGETVRPRWVKHESEFKRFLPLFMDLPPRTEPLIPGKLERGKFVRLRDFLDKIARQLKGVEVTPTGKPKGFLWAFWRFEEYAGPPGKTDPGTYLRISVYYVPKGISKAWWSASREDTPVGFPRTLTLG